MPRPVRLRAATPGDRALLEYWDTKPHVINASGDDGDMDWAVALARDAEWQQILVAEVDGRPVGVLQIIDPHAEISHYWGAIAENLRAIDIWIGEEGDLGRGYGTQMMRQALGYCFADPAVQAVLIDPLERNLPAIRFYERIGFRFVERRRFGTDDCCVYRFDRADYPPP